MYTSEAQIEEFLTEYKRSRIIAETSVRAILRRAVEWENKFDKAFYEFNKEEALEMFKSAHAISVVSLQNANLTLKHAARYFKNQVGGNVYEEIGKYDLEECVDKDKKSGLILTKEEIEDIQGQLLNWVDKSILFLLFEGVGGYKLSELTFMSKDQINRKDLQIYLRSGKVINITPEDYEMLCKGFEEDELISFGETMRVSKVRSSGLYKIRCNALSDNDDPTNSDDRERRYRWLQRRLMLISQNFDIQLTSGSIQESGLLYYIKEEMRDSGMDFLEYIKSKEARALAWRYDIRSNLYPQILKDKFYKYFQ